MMNLLTILGISAALGMDCFAVCIAAGTAIKSSRLNKALQIALLFGLFQGLMTLIGWIGGTTVSAYIESYDHIIGAVLLFIVGGKMIQEGIAEGEETDEDSFSGFMMLSILAIATSIDALAVGLSFAVLNTDIIMPSIIIGLGSIVLSLLGFLLGNRFGHYIGSRAEILGGVILILIGLHILYDGIYLTV